MMQHFVYHVIYGASFHGPKFDASIVQFLCDRIVPGNQYIWLLMLGYLTRIAPLSDLETLGFMKHILGHLDSSSFHSVNYTMVTVDIFDKVHLRQSCDLLWTAYYRFIDSWDLYKVTRDLADLDQFEFIVSHEQFRIHPNRNNVVALYMNEEKQAICRRLGYL